MGLGGEPTPLRRRVWLSDSTATGRDKLEVSGMAGALLANDLASSSLFRIHTLKKGANTGLAGPVPLGEFTGEFSCL
jgi:hypothetical protein